MRALQITAPGQFELRDVPTPEAGPGEVLLQVQAVTTCPHWDIHILGGEPMFPGSTIEYPYMLGQPGHEACGVITALGDGVTEVAVGQRVCAWRDRGHHVPGCYAQYVAMGVENVIPVSDDLPPEACAPLELAMCISAHILYAEKLDTITGGCVGVFGLGPAGLVTVQLARAAGAFEVIGFDPLPARRDLATALGADRVLDPQGEEAKNLPKRNAPGALDCTFDCVGKPAAVHRAMELTNELVVLFAVQREPYAYAPHCWPGLTLAGTRPHTREAAHYARAVELLERQEAVKVAFLPQES